jgi:hypothetical protein
MTDLVTKWSPNPSDRAVSASPSGCASALCTGRDQHRCKTLDVSVRRWADDPSDSLRCADHNKRRSASCQTAGRPEWSRNGHRSGQCGDSFDAIWRSILEDIELSYLTAPTGFATDGEQARVSALDLISRVIVSPDGSTRSLRPDDVRRALSISRTGATQQVVVIDEFDRVHDAAVRHLFADTLKALSDQAVPATIILVGVADSVDQLIEEHPSIERSLAQIHMPTKSADELAEIIDKGMAVAKLDVDGDFREDVVRLAHGLPNYVHLLAQNAAKHAVKAGRQTVIRLDLDPAIQRSLEMVDESVLQAYHRATTSNRETLYKDVLLACALAPRDERDTFSAVDVRDQLVAITDEYRDIPAFAGHLKDFSGTGDRGGILDRLGTQRKYQYRFKNPLLPPFVLMKGRLDVGSQASGRLPMWISGDAAESKRLS